MYSPSIRSWRLQRAFAALMLGTFAACGASDGAPAGPANDPSNGGSGGNSGGTKGVVSGRVTDGQGRPIAGATVIINNAVWFNRNIVLKSANDGSYRYTMPATDSWYVRGTTEISYNGRTYVLDLHPDRSGSFSGTDGAVVNLQWKVTGPVPTEFGDQGFYGGSVEMNAGWDLGDLAGVTLTLTPVGPLIDGSTGATITRTVSEIVSDYAVRDVPLGRYRVQASLNGKPMVLRMRHTSAYTPEITTDFEPAYPGATDYGIYFDVATTVLGGD